MNFESLLPALREHRKVTLHNVFEGNKAHVLSAIRRELGQTRPIMCVCTNEKSAQSLRQMLLFFEPDAKILVVPAWDTVPYDRISPSQSISATRMQAFCTLALSRQQPDFVLITVNSLVQRIPPMEFLRASVKKFRPGAQINTAKLVRWLERHGFMRTGTVRETGEFAPRGGIIDIFTPLHKRPVRLDFFGNSLESIRRFDPESQRTTGQMQSFNLLGVSEVSLTKESISFFQQRFREAFGIDLATDPVYQGVREGRRMPGMEQWLGYFHHSTQTILELCSNHTLIFDLAAMDHLQARLDQIEEHYQARIEALNEKSRLETVYHPAKPQELYLTRNELEFTLRQRSTIHFAAFDAPDGTLVNKLSTNCKIGINFTAGRVENGSVFDVVAAEVLQEIRGGRPVVVACWSQGSRERMAQLLTDHGVRQCSHSANWQEVRATKMQQVHLVVAPLEHGYVCDGCTFVSEQDILGERVSRTAKKRSGKDTILEANTLHIGDLVVHIQHGIGRFAGLEAVEVAGAPHDCIALEYAEEGKLFLPIENIELLSRYGPDHENARLDRLGGAGWQARKARLKKQLLAIADDLIRLAAQRKLRPAERFVPDAGYYNEFAARFQFEETEDQLESVEQVLTDLAAGLPMDRLVCGDVGFGKTEIALRAAFTVASNGKQVAVIVPTTLLARQHAKTFADRFVGLPIKVRQASRLVGATRLRQTKQGLADGTIDIVVGTHALLGTNIEFARLGLLIVDEEQRFGVKHKERIKELKSDVHVLTLTATPIPRTLQLAMSGVRELSIISTPPVDRLAIRTSVTPHDALMVREAILREYQRGGQCFYVAPRISDLIQIMDFLEKQVPEVKAVVAHGQMSPGQLDTIMNAFYDRRFDVLVSTTIVENGLDIPTANTLIVHRAHMFGLAQLYQLRGRVGRSKQRAYAIFSTPANLTLTPVAMKRLRVIQSLDSLGAGFQLASHDMDIRGAGNLLGQEQSGHINEVGYELYQSMLEEAIASLKAGEFEETIAEAWSPAIQLGTPAMIPEQYVSDLQLRLDLYRRLAAFDDVDQIEQFAMELNDRFGPIPPIGEQLLKLMTIKSLCKKANISRLEAGQKGMVVGFHDGWFANPEGLMMLIHQHGDAKIRPDQTIFFGANWQDDKIRLNGVARIVQQILRAANPPTSAVQPALAAQISAQR